MPLMDFSGDFTEVKLYGYRTFKKNKEEVHCAGTNIMGGSAGPRL